ncbi:class II glutamine amidotransferase [Actinomadura macrotermitis]|uniref:Gamma-glutamyl-hercynylcysteine sulfoxide hydrolase n=1 Tax=Actinomadura macrotermitis TaxID=2585200 RepID=A0A7K0BMR6_9ACTN|nr:class II glutamine amidotransferase [Actinomadura macrotermitis]MQY01994.1 Gamma-glutamyl-hercynylcysteine sulfoxide hydrolase [Actinomadura macrotermitis]
MCRLFGMTTGGPRVRATFWLLDAPQSLRSQSHRMPDGTGLGWFSLGDEPVRDRAPVAAFENGDFDSEARNVVSHTFVSHVRYASTGAVDVHNSHPFDMNDRLFAHNGVVQGLDVLDSWLSDVDRALMEGQTDSELVFAYITAEIRRHGGDTTAGLVAAVRRIAAELPVYALNLLLAEPRRLWALRYPDPNELWVLSPDLGGRGIRHLGAGHEPGSLDVACADGDHVPAWVIASEPMDDDPDWRLLAPGELLVVDGLEAVSLFPFEAPAHPLTTADLSLAEATSQV